SAPATSGAPTRPGRTGDAPAGARPTSSPPRSAMPASLRWPWASPRAPRAPRARSSWKCRWRSPAATRPAAKCARWGATSCAARRSMARPAAGTSPPRSCANCSPEALALGLEHGPGASGRAAAAAPQLLQLRRVPLVERDAVVVGQLLAGRDVADRLDEDLVLVRT